MSHSLSAIFLKTIGALGRGDTRPLENRALSPTQRIIEKNCWSAFDRTKVAKQWWRRPVAKILSETSNTLIIAELVGWFGR